MVSLDDEDAPRKLDKAFADTGFAILTGDMIPDPEELRSLGRAFFSGRTTAEKLRCNGDKGDAGYGNVPYVPLGGENNAQLLGDFDTPSDALESLTLRGLQDAGVRDRLMKDLPVDLGAAMVRYSRSLDPLRERLVPLVESALGVESGSMGSVCRDALDSVRLGFYPDMAMGEGQVRRADPPDPRHPRAARRHLTHPPAARTPRPASSGRGRTPTRTASRSSRWTRTPRTGWRCSSTSAARRRTVRAPRARRRSGGRFRTCRGR